MRARGPAGQMPPGQRTGSGSGRGTRDRIGFHRFPVHRVETLERSTRGRRREDVPLSAEPRWKSFPDVRGWSFAEHEGSGKPPFELRTMHAGLAECRTEHPIGVGGRHEVRGTRIAVRVRPRRDTASRPCRFPSPRGIASRTPRSQKTSSRARSSRMAAARPAPFTTSLGPGRRQEGRRPGRADTGWISAIGLPWRRRITVSPRSTSSRNDAALARNSVKETAFIRFDLRVVCVKPAHAGHARPVLYMNVHLPRMPFHAPGVAIPDRRKESTSRVVWPASGRGRVRWEVSARPSPASAPPCPPFFPASSPRHGRCRLRSPTIRRG